MTDAKITCPSCSSEIPLTESLAGPLLAAERAESARRLKAAEEKAAAELERQRTADRAAMKAEAEASARAEAAADAARAKAALEDKDRELARILAEANTQREQLVAARKAEADALAKERALADREAALELTVQQRLRDSLKEREAALRAQAEALEAQRLAELREAHEQSLGQKDEQLAQMKRQIEALKQKAEQGSMQTQGEAAELRLEDRLAQAFPMDGLEPVGKGVRGADCLQTVRTAVGVAGRLIWESKAASNWSKDWLPKLRDDQRQAGADIAILVSRVRPEDIDSFAEVDGVWVAAPQYAVPLAAALRAGLMEVAAARGAREGQATKTEMLYDYLTGPQFRARVEAVVERFEQMRTDLERERRTMMQSWARREKALTGALDGMVGMYGDVQGIAGHAVPDIEGLGLPLLGDEAAE